MKTYIKQTTILVLAVLSFSCEDMLDDVKNYGGIPADEFVTSVENAQTAVNGAYSGLYGLQLFRSQIYYYLDFASNELEYRSLNGNLRVMTNFGYFDGSTFIANYWKDLYSLVARSNDACSKIYALRNSGTLTVPENQELDKMIGECNFLRGLGYFYLTCSFGDKLPSHPNYKPEELGVPIADTLVLTKQQLYKQRNTLGECWDEIICDFETAYNNLPDSWTSSKLGAVTKGAAAGYLGQVYMYLKEYEKAKEWFEESMKVGKYQLVDYAWNFDLDHENNAESIFEVQFQTIASDIVLASYMWRNFGPGPKHWGDVNVSQEYVNKLTIDLTLTQEIYDDIINHLDRYMEQRTMRTKLRNVLELAFKDVIGITVASPEEFFQLYTGDWSALATTIGIDINTDDPLWGTVNSRFVKIIYRAAVQGDPRMYDSFYVPYRDSISNSWSGTDPFIYNTDYYGFKKYIPFNSVDDLNQDGVPSFAGYNSINQRIFRLSDLYLQYAEACYQTENEATAKEYLNKVRRRAWKQPVDVASSYDFTTGNFMQALVAEREKELCLEGHLWFDYLRWWDSNKIDEFKTRGFDPTIHHRLPIPLSERQVVGEKVLKQNEGY